MDGLTMGNLGRSRKVHNALCMVMQGNGTRITKDISVQNGLDAWQSKLESRLQSCFFFFFANLAFLTLISAVVKS